MKTGSFKQFLFPAAVLLYSVVCAVCIPLTGDDYPMYYAMELENCYAASFYNGRYLANNLAYLLIRYPAVRLILFPLLLSALVLLLSKFVQFGKQQQTVSWLAFGLFLLMPAIYFSQTVMWLFAFAVHAVPIIFTLIYMRICFCEFQVTREPKKSRILLCGILGFAGAFFVEHIAILNAVFGLFVCVYALLHKEKRLRAYQVAFAVCAVTGLCLMLLDPLSMVAAGHGSQSGFRAVSIDISDIIYNVYISVVPLFAKEFFLLHSVIAGALMILLSRADAEKWSVPRRRYVRLSMNCTAAYAAYTVLNKACTPLRSLTGAERIRALEAAFVFLYMISVLYLAYVLTGKERFLRVTVYECSAIVLAAPFSVVNPVTHRCFFAVFCFWLLLAAELFCAASENQAERAKQLSRACIAAMCCTAGGILIYIHAVNAFVYRFSLRYLKEQVSGGNRIIEVLEVPYPDYTNADFEVYLPELNSDSELNMAVSLQKGEALEGYTELMLRYYGLEQIKEIEKLRVIAIPYYSFTL